MGSPESRLPRIKAPTHVELYGAPPNVGIPLFLVYGEAQYEREPGIGESGLGEPMIRGAHEC